MKTVLRKHASALLLVVGVGTIAAAILLDLVRGQPLIIGWVQFFLLFGGGIALIMALPPVQRSLRSLLDRSHETSPATQARLRRQPARYLLYSLWFALVVSLGEVFFWSYEKAFLNRPLGIQYIWGIPIGYGVLFLGIGLLFLLAARRWPGRVALRGLVFTGVFVCLSGWLFLVKGLHDLAATVLAAGIAVQLTRLTARHAFLFHTLVRRTLPWLALVVLGLAGGFFFGPGLAEQRTIAQLSPVEEDAPNVLLLVLDTVRAKSLSLYGYERPTTPNLDRLAARGTVFERAFSTSPWTLPSHGSMFTGRLPHELSGAWITPIDATHPTLAEVLGGQGYVSAGFVANTTYCSAEFGLSRGFIHYEDHSTSLTKALAGTSFGSTFVHLLQLKKHFATHDNFDLKSAEQVNGDFLGWLANYDEDRPFFVFLNYYDAHAPYFSPDEFARKFSATRTGADIWARRLDAWAPEEIPALNDAYDASIAYLDHHLGRLFDELERRGTLENTVIIVTSDHGEQFGEHGLLEHANSLYLPLLHVPLFIVYPPAVPAGRRTDAYVSLRDLPATVMDLTGQPDPVGFPGHSLAAHWPDSLASSPGAGAILLAEVQRAYDAYPDSYPARIGSMKSVIFNGMHYIKNYGDGREELYNLEQDFEEASDLVETERLLLEAYRRHLEHMRQGGSNHTR